MKKINGHIFSVILLASIMTTSGVAHSQELYSEILNINEAKKYNGYRCEESRVLSIGQYAADRVTRYHLRRRDNITEYGYPVFELIRTQFDRARPSGQISNEITETLYKDVVCYKVSKNDPRISVCSVSDNPSFAGRIWTQKVNKTFVFDAYDRTVESQKITMDIFGSASLKVEFTEERCVLNN